jgi:hypothetical protein
MARALLAHLQQALHKHFIYCVHVKSIGCYQDWSGKGSRAPPPLAAARRQNIHEKYQLLFVRRLLKMSK